MKVQRTADWSHPGPLVRAGIAIGTHGPGAHVDVVVAAPLVLTMRGRVWLLAAVSWYRSAQGEVEGLPTAVHAPVC